MSLRDILNVVWRRRWLIPLTCGMALLAVWSLGRPAPPADPTYTGTLNITSEAPNAAPQRNSDSPASYYSFVGSQTPAIADRVAADLGDDLYGPNVSTSQAILASIEVTELAEIGTITFTFSDQPSESVARDVMDSFGFHLTEFAREQFLEDYEANLETLEVREQGLRARIDDLTQELEALAENLTEEQIQARVSPDVTKEAERQVAIESLGQVITEIETLRALPEDEKSPLRVEGTPSVAADEMPPVPLGFRERLALATLLGALFGIALTFALHRFDTRLFNRKDAEAAFALPVLAEIPKIRWFRRRRYRLITAADPGAPASEAYRLLRSGIARIRRLQLVRDGSDDRHLVVLVTSASAGVGKSSLAANLAVASVDAGQRVLVVGADLRQPKIELLCGAEPVVGLTDCVDEVEERGVDLVDLDRYLVATRHPGVTLLGHGHPVQNPGERLAAARPIIDALRQRFDMVIIDSPPMLIGNDVSEIVPYVDMMLLVARAGATKHEEATWAKETAERMQAPVCGVALVGSSSGPQRRGHYNNRFSWLAQVVAKLPFIRSPSGSRSASNTARAGGNATPETQPSLPFGTELNPGRSSAGGSADLDQSELAKLAPPTVGEDLVPIQSMPTVETNGVANHNDHQTADRKPADRTTDGDKPDEDVTVVLAIPDITDLLSEDESNATTSNGHDNDDDAPTASDASEADAPRNGASDPAPVANGSAETTDVPVEGDAIEFDLDLELVDED